MTLPPPILGTLDTCRSCGYSLATLADDAVCPECATPVSVSRRPDQLVFADPAWLRRLMRGFALLGIAASAALLTLLTLILAIVVGIIAPDEVAARVSPLLGWLTTVLAYVAPVAALVGVIFVTSQDPRESLSERTSAPRLVFRMAIGATVVVAAMHMTARSFLPATLAPPWNYAVIIALGTSVHLALSAGLSFFGRLAQRMDSRQLVDQCGTLAKLFRWSVPGLVIATLAARLAPALGGGFSLLTRILPEVLRAVCVIALFIGFIRLCSLLVRFRRGFATIWNQARIDSSQNRSAEATNK